MELRKLYGVYEKAAELRQKLAHPYCAAVIVAAGSAARMEGTDKIFTVLDRLPVICRTMDAFQRCALIDEIVLVARADTMERMSRLCPAYPKARIVKFGAAAPAIAVKDTIKISSDGTVQSTPDRKMLFAVQTPQIFDADLLRGALQNALEKQLPVTDDCSAVEAIGMTVQLTEGSEENIKLTTPLDLELAEAILRRRERA